MKDAFFEVLKDLWNFVFGADTRVKYENIEARDVVVTYKKSLVQVKDSVKAPIVQTAVSDTQIGQSAYVCVDVALCLSQPSVSLDGKLGEFYYGDRVTVLRLDGGFAEVRIRDTRGWLSVDSLTEDRSKVMPDFKSAYVYGSTDEQTIKLRRLIKDEALTGQLELPLQPIELILFILKTKNAKIGWPATRPRIVGLWNIILRGIKGISMSIEPHTNSIIEYSGTESKGFVGYIEAVHPDLSITLKSVGRVEPGEYRVEEFTHDEWKEWRPVFISYT
ncbi:MAG: hypothetical protein LR008_01860 [Candidatus Pacebacteria bacterium]|nr:hypothetical protein [Candidatus Paceibacterota bacterium]